MFALWRGRFDLYCDDCLINYARLRATEWKSLPLFAAQPIVPILLIRFSPSLIVGSVLFLNLLWRFVRFRLLAIRPVKLPKSEILTAGIVHAEYGTARLTGINLIRFAHAVNWMVHLKWPIAIAVSIWLVEVAGQPKRAVVAILWPMITLLLIRVSPASSPTGVVQKRFLLAMNFIPSGGEPDSCLLRDFHRSVPNS
jgi:hypothetical protein